MLLIKNRHIVEKKIQHYCSYWKIPKGSHVLVACSGGGDSTALIFGMSRLDDIPVYEISCGCLDHGLRSKEETEGDILFLQELTSRLGVPFYFKKNRKGELRRIAALGGRSLEEVARERRYDFLRSLAKRISADFIAVGHTMDDQLETLIMRFFQGAGFTGLTGIPVKRGKIIRPLSMSTHEEITDYLRDNSLRYRLDSTNMNENFLRNKIRLKIIPVVKDIFPAYQKSLVSLSSKMNILKTFVENEVSSRSSWEECTGGKFKMRGESFLKIPGIIRLHSLYELFNRIKKGDQVGSTGEQKRDVRVPYRFFASAQNDEWFFPKRVLLRGYGVKLSWCCDDLFFEKDIVSYNKKGYLIFVQKDRMYTIEGLGISVKTDDKYIESEHKNSIFLNKEKTEFPIIIRSKRPGDRISYEGGNKSLKKLYNEWKVPVNERWKIPVVADKSGILGIMGEIAGFRNRYSDKIHFRYDNSTVTINFSSTEQARG